MPQEQKQIEHTEAHQADDDKFAIVMRPFRDQSETMIAQFEERIARCHEELKEVMQLFGEAPGQNECEEFFGLIQRFSQNLLIAHHENEREAAMAARAASRRPSIPTQPAAPVATAATKNPAHEKSDSLVDNVFGRLKARQTASMTLQ